MSDSSDDNSTDDGVVGASNRSNIIDSDTSEGPLINTSEGPFMNTGSQQESSERAESSVRADSSEDGETSFRPDSSEGSDGVLFSSDESDAATWVPGNINETIDSDETESLHSVNSVGSSGSGRIDSRSSSRDDRPISIGTTADDSDSSQDNIDVVNGGLDLRTESSSRTRPPSRSTHASRLSRRDSRRNNTQGGSIGTNDGLLDLGYNVGNDIANIVSGVNTSITTSTSTSGSIFSIPRFTRTQQFPPSRYSSCRHDNLPPQNSPQPGPSVEDRSLPLLPNRLTPLPLDLHPVFPTLNSDRHFSLYNHLDGSLFPNLRRLSVIGHGNSIPPSENSAVQSIDSDNESDVEFIGSSSPTLIEVSW